MRMRAAYLVYSLLIVALTGAYLLAREYFTSSLGISHEQSESALVVDESDLQFGTITAGSELQTKIHIHNTTDEVITVSQLVASCHCTEVNPDEIVLQPRESSAITLQIAVPPLAKAAAEAPLDVTLKALYSGEGGGSNSKLWKITGTVVSPFQLTPFRTHFSESDNWTSDGRFCKKHISFTSDRPISTLDVTVTPPLLSVTVEQDTSRSGVIIIQPIVEKLVAGSFECHVEVDGLVAANEHLQAFARVSGIVVGELYSVPSKLVVGPSAVGSEEWLTISLRTHTNKPFKFVSCDSTNPNTIFDTAEFSDGKSKVIRINQTVVQPGVQSESVTVSLAVEGESESREVHIPLTVIGLPSKPKGGNQ